MLFKILVFWDFVYNGEGKKIMVVFYFDYEMKFETFILFFFIFLILYLSFIYIFLVNFVFFSKAYKLKTGLLFKIRKL